MSPSGTVADGMNPHMTGDWLIWQLADSAFPTGTFAHSWGLESAWQHGEIAGTRDLQLFLDASLVQAGFTVLPFVNEAYADPAALDDLDALADAFLTNEVANRASRIQGRTLVATAARIWPSPQMDVLKTRAYAGCAHLAPIAGAAFRTLGLPADAARRLLLFGTARGVLSAAVRLGIVGSYEAQRMQHACAPALEQVARRCAPVAREDLAQTAPLIDLLQSAHDRLYSRLFQS